MPLLAHMIFQQRKRCYNNVEQLRREIGYARIYIHYLPLVTGLHAGRLWKVCVKEVLCPSISNYVPVRNVDSIDSTWYAASSYLPSGGNRRWADPLM